ncbi:chaperonin 10-like protein [Butyriboletus roseoflavus]|nr:chaperonin 10-like protein [Butyriboletus roseoflavus]
MSSSDNTIPTTQKAWIVVKQGKPRDALVFKTDCPVPRPKPGEVLVRIRAAALNPVGWKFMGTLPTMLSKNLIPEHDLAGVIANANGMSFSDGDEVIGYFPFGALAQYATLPEANVTLKPTKLTWEEAAALPLAASTATQALRLGGYDPARALANTPAPSPDNQQSIFINGGSTSVGIYAIQLAKALSLRVTASASARNESFVRSVGADTFLDYTAQPIAEQLLANPPNPPFSMVFDAAGYFGHRNIRQIGTHM